MVPHSNSDVAFRDGGDGGSGGGVSGNQHTGTAVGGDATPNSDSDRQGYPGAGPYGTAPENDGAGGGGGGAGGAGPMKRLSYCRWSCWWSWCSSCYRWTYFKIYWCRC